MPAATAPPAAASTHDPDESWLVGQFLHITDIHPDEHYINGGTIASSCHSTTEDDDDDDDGDDDDDDVDKHDRKADSKKLVSYWHEWFRSSNPFRRFSKPRSERQYPHDMEQRKHKKVSTMRPGRTSGGHGGVFGAPYSICDSPFSLVNVTFDWIDKNLVNEIDFIVWTGDNARHDSDNEHPRTQQEIEELNRMIANKFLDMFAPDPNDPLQRRLPIIPSIGNNDVYPHNIMEAGPNRILQHFSDIWSEFIPESQYHTFQFGGYYITEVIEDKLCVVALNTLFFFNQNTAVDGCDDDDEPGAMQMDWLEVELRALRSRKMSVYLTGHVPPARKSYEPTCYRRYSEIALKYQDVIVGHFFGHANIDHFIIMSDDAISKGPVPGSTGNNNNNLNDDHDQEEPVTTEFNAYSSTGLSSYLIELWEQYESIPKRAKLNNYAIANVGPSVIPTYNPSLRVYGYQLNKHSTLDAKESDNEALVGGGIVVPGNLANQHRFAMADVTEDKEAEGQEKDHESEGQIESSEYEDEDEEDEEEGEHADEWETQMKKKKKRKPRKKPRKPRRPTYPPSPDPLTKFGHPLHYTQYWMNLTLVNEEQQAYRRRMQFRSLGDDPTPPPVPEFAVEYRTKEDYGLKTLGVQEYLTLARRIVSDSKLKDQYLAWMVVLTGTENEH
ncbi:Endopolyphosphatase [Actinomortierella ambigua]|uniref:Endopolyphosphatase n=1 Tax=Actinomortierella ambigua TaxID=1343610 RepID=A0A9P6QB91_9FUNG|nr:Endopolyphosphatase [Actinomortierella ambigua]